MAQVDGQTRYTLAAEREGVIDPLSRKIHQSPLRADYCVYVSNSRRAFRRPPMASLELE